MPGDERNGGSRLQVYHPRLNKWETWGKIPFAKKRDLGSVSVVVIHGIIRMCGGLDSTGEINYKGCAKLNPVTRKWTKFPNMLVGVNHQAAGTDGEKMYVFGGRTNIRNELDNGIKKVQIYDPRANRWSFGPEMLWGRGGHGHAPFINGLFYLLGGEERYPPTHSTENLVFEQVHSFNPSTGKWSSDHPRLTAGVHGIYPVADQQRGLIYVAAGSWKAGFSQTNRFQVFNVGTDLRGRRGSEIAGAANIDREMAEKTRRGAPIRLVCLTMTFGAPAQNLDCGVHYEISHFRVAKYGSSQKVRGYCSNYTSVAEVPQRTFEAANLLEPECVGKTNCWINTDPFQSTAIKDRGVVLVIEAECTMAAPAASAETKMVKAGNGYCRTSKNGDAGKTKKINGSTSLRQCLKACKAAISCVGAEFDRGNCRMLAEKVTHVKAKKRVKCYRKQDGKSADTEAAGLDVCNESHAPL